MPPAAATGGGADGGRRSGQPRAGAAGPVPAPTWRAPKRERDLGVAAANQHQQRLALVACGAERARPLRSRFAATTSFACSTTSPVRKPARAGRRVRRDVGDGEGCRPARRRRARSRRAPRRTSPDAARAADQASAQRRSAGDRSPRSLPPSPAARQRRRRSRITRSARRTRSRVRHLRGDAGSGPRRRVMPRDAVTRATAVSGSTITTQTSSKNRQPASISTAASTTIGVVLELGLRALQPVAHGEPDQRVDDGVQPRQRVGIGEHLGAKRAAIDRAVGRDDVRAERLGRPGGSPPSRADRRRGRPCRCR